MNTIATINDTLLPVVLFIIYFIFASVVGYSLKDKTSVSTSATVPQTLEQDLEESPKTFTYKDAFSPQFDPEPKEEIVASVANETLTENTASIVTQNPKIQFSDSQITTSAIARSLPEIIDSLGKRELRKLCSPLGIKQKTNVTELTTELMKALVKRKLKENPQKVVKVISDRLPQLVTTLPELNQQQPLEILAC